MFGGKVDSDGDEIPDDEDDDDDNDGIPDSQGNRRQTSADRLLGLHSHLGENLT